MSTLSRWLQSKPQEFPRATIPGAHQWLRAKERALETTSHELKVKTAAMQIARAQDHVVRDAMHLSPTRADRPQRATEDARIRIGYPVKRLTDLETEGSAARQR